HRGASGQWVRFGAFVIDLVSLMVLSIPLTVIAFLASGADLMNPATSALYAPWQLGLGVLLWGLYWGVPESLWSCSLGKWLLGLRVRAAVGADPPGPARIAVRTLCFYVLVNLGTIGGLPFLWGLDNAPPEEQMARSLYSSLVYYPLLALSIGLILCTMR